MSISPPSGKTDPAPEAGWGALTSALAAACDGLPAPAVPAVILSLPHQGAPAAPPFRAGTTVNVRCGPGETAVLMLTSPGNRWLLSELRYEDKPDRTIFAIGGANQVPAGAVELLGRLLKAHSGIVAERGAEAARLAEDGTRPRAVDKRYGRWDGHELTLDVPGGPAAFAYAAAHWYFLSGPRGPSSPAPLDSWDNFTGGFLIRNGNTYEALLGHLLSARSYPQEPAAVNVGPPKQGSPVPARRQGTAAAQPRRAGPTAGPRRG
jgi:hypothetical protein